MGRGDTAMRHRLLAFFTILAILPILWAFRVSAGVGREPTESPLNVLAVETFLADIARNVAGNRLKIGTLLPVGADPHAFDPTPNDVMKVAGSNVLIVNGAGLEEFQDKLLRNAGGVHKVIEASAGLTSRTPGAGEKAEAEEDHDKHDRDRHHHESDPHFWLNPQNAIKYAENIRDGLSQADPDGKETYRANADGYIAQLRELDHWIEDQVEQIPKDRRLLVTNHDNFGYFADRYGFKVIGTILPSISTEVSPSAQQLAHLIDGIRATRTPALFLESGTNPLHD